MNLSFNLKQASRYTSQPQRIRVLTENWVHDQIYCPNCGHLNINRHPANKPVSDFFCSNCKEDYELKSKQNSLGLKILDGAYRTMIECLQSSRHPNFFLLNYDLRNYEVLNFFVIPKHFFVPGIIEKRRPLASTARRAGWVGCNILLESIPQTGKIFLVKNRAIEPKAKVLSEWKKTLFLREENEISAKGWLLDVMRCVDVLGRKDFSLDDVYVFENELREMHPDNRHVKDKIRQQLQILRNKGYLEFIRRGRYRRT